MRRSWLLLGALLGGLTGLPLIALSYLGGQWAGLPFVPFDIFDWLARVLPGVILRTTIDLIVRLVTVLHLGPTSIAAKQIEQFLAILLVVAGTMVVGAIQALSLRHTSLSGVRVGTRVGLVLFALVVSVEAALGTSLGSRPVGAVLWLAMLILSWPIVLGMGLAALGADGAVSRASEAPRVSRRTLLAKLAGGSIGLALAAWGIGRLIGGSASITGAGRPLLRPAGNSESLMRSAGGETAAALRGRIPPAPGTRPEVTPTARFYRVDIDARSPVIDEANWVLRVGGLFERPRPLRLADLQAFPAVTQAITLCCISNPVGGDLVGTTYYTGVRLRDLLQHLGLRPEARALQVDAVDGFFERVTLQDMSDPRTLLVYGMNGETLPPAHGFPLRIYIPNRYGMKQPKWIASIKAIDRTEGGYWEDRDWSKQAIPQVISVIDTVAVGDLRDDRIPVGGIAWAGDRGIRKVEIQVNGGPWIEAVLRTPPLSPLAWVQWRYDWPKLPGRHTFRVRATDGTGALQVETLHDPYPDGATGYQSVTVTV